MVGKIQIPIMNMIFDSYEAFQAFWETNSVFMCGYKGRLVVRNEHGDAIEYRSLQELAEAYEEL